MNAETIGTIYVTGATIGIYPVVIFVLGFIAHFLWKNTSYYSIHREPAPDFFDDITLILVSCLGSLLLLMVWPLTLLFGSIWGIFELAYLCNGQGRLAHALKEGKEDE